LADGQQAVELLRDRFAEDVLETGSFRDQHWALVSLERLEEIARFLRADEATDYDFLVDVTAVHWPDAEQPMQLVYHLYSYARNDRLRLKAWAADKGPVPTLSGIWKAAAWNERETYDMFGIEFGGHPDLRRILMPDDYTDFPLRKEFPLYRG
jgi:NADH-quinone oxidoreductase subunit C